MNTQETMPAQEAMPAQELNQSSPEDMPNQELNMSAQEGMPVQEMNCPGYYNPPALNLDTITTVTMPVLYPGNNGDAVRFLQQILLSCGYRMVQFNANFDRSTYLGVINFQRNNGLVVDGIVGWHTWRKLGEVLYSRHRHF